MTKTDWWTAFGIFAGIETTFGLLVCNDACKQFVKTYPGLTLGLMVTLLAGLVTLAGVSIRLSRKLRRKPVPAIEVIHAERGHLLP